jgi:transposase-like protein
MTIDINNLTDEQKINSRSPSIVEKGFVCPHCGAAHVVRRGIYKGGRQRYLCRNCKSTFSDLTNTLLRRAKFSGKWSAFAECMLKRLFSP